MRARRYLRQLGVGVFAVLLAASSALGALAADPVGTTGGSATLRASDAVIKVTKRGNFRVTEANISTTDTEEFVGNGFAPGEVVSVFLTLPDGRVFPIVNSAYNDTPCCPQSDQVLADGTGSIYFEIAFANFSSKTGSLTDGVRFTSTIFFLPDEFELASLPYGRYMVTAIGRVSLQKAATPVQLIPPGPPGILDGSTTTTGTLTVFTTIGHRTSAKQVDPGLVPSGVVDNPNVDIACNGLIPGEFVSFWDTYPDGSAVTLSTIAADDGGSAIIQVELLTGKFPTGLHTFTCRGNQSNYYLTGSFLLLPGNIPAQSSIGNLTCSYVGAAQAVANATFPQLPSFFASDYLLCTARNFRPNETVTFWQTFPDQTSHFLATVKANEAGAAVVVIQLFPGPIAYQRGKAVLGDAALYQIAYPAGVDGRIPTGRHYFSARGDTTVRTATFPFDLLPSQVDP